jgi:hypothetical protein
MRTIDKIITEVSTIYGAPMGRPNVGTMETVSTNLKGETVKFFNIEKKRIYDCAVPMSGDGAYDKGGAYWGLGAQLRVSYTKDLSYVNFYRKGEKW